MVFIDWFLIWWLHRGRYGWSRLRRRLCERRYLSTTLPPVSSLEDIKVCLGQITWTMDGPLRLFDSISYPQTVWASRKDDCDGFSVLAAALLRWWDPDIKPTLVTAITHPVKNSHTVCAFNSPEGKLWFFDNASLREGDYSTYQEIVSDISGRAQRLVCWDVRDPESFEMVEFHK